MTVAVIGAGIVGLCAALEIQRAGHHLPPSIAPVGIAFCVRQALTDGRPPPFDPAPYSARRPA